MATVIRAKNALLMAADEAVEGVEEVLTAADDAVLVSNLRLTFNPQIEETDEATASLDDNEPIVGGMTAGIQFDVYLKGSGTAGVVPEYGHLLKSAGWQETAQAAAFPVAPEACAAGGSLTTAVLGASASAVNDAYLGMPISFTGTVALDTFVVAYDGASKTATLASPASVPIVADTNWQIPAHVLYSPATTSIPSETIHTYFDGIRYRFLGCRATGSFAFTTGQTGKATLNFNGIFVDKDDTANPSSPVFDAVRPPIWKNGLFAINQQLAAVQSLSLDMGLTLTNPANPNAVEGFDPAQITRRRMQGQMDPQEVLNATRNTMQAFRTGGTHAVAARSGGVAGNRWGFVVPEALYVNHSPGDREGVATVGTPFRTKGPDKGAFLSLL